LVEHIFRLVSLRGITIILFKAKRNN